jgi:hypothetical protein
MDAFGILTAAFGGHLACAALWYARMGTVGNARRIIGEGVNLMAIVRRFLIARGRSRRCNPHQH